MRTRNKPYCRFTARGAYSNTGSKDLHGWSDLRCTVVSNNNEAVFCWAQEGFYGFSLWEAAMLWGGLMGVTLVFMLLHSAQQQQCTWMCVFDSLNYHRYSWSERTLWISGPPDNGNWPPAALEPSYVALRLTLPVSAVDYMYVKMVICQCPRVAWNFPTPLRFPANKQGSIVEYKAEKGTHLIEPTVRKSLLVPI
jgi:hypothetical protein